MESFESKFWRHVNRPQTKGDLALRDVMDKVGRVFSGKKQRLVVRLLDVVSDPLTEKRLKRVGGEINPQFLQLFFHSGPSRKELGNLARRLRTIGRDLDRAFGTEAVPSSKASLFLKLAEDCESRAKDLKYIIMARAMDATPAKVSRTLTYKAFWKHLPITKLCRELEAPSSISFSEIETLLRCAYFVRKLPWSRAPRSIEREYNGFRKWKSDDPLKSTEWPKILDGLLLQTLATK